MSYDFEIWSVRRFQPALLSKAQQGALSGRGWQIVINPSDKILPEDADEEVAALIPGISYVTVLNLEGDATPQAMKLAQSTAKEIAKRLHGVLADLQTDRITTPSGVTRFLPPKESKKLSLLNFNWWFLNDMLQKEKGIISFLDLLQRLLPEALPVRYGDYEPPQYALAKTGVKHLARSIRRNLDIALVWFPKRPVSTVSISGPKPLGPGPKGFRTNEVEIQVECSALNQPGWAEQLQHFWRQAALFLKPIYGEVRTEGGYLLSRGRIYATPELIRNHYPHTTRSYFWRGVPRKLGHAVVLGRTYQRVWPAFVKKATMEKGFAFASTPDWSDSTDLLKIVGPAPKAITLLPGEGLGRKQKYPRTWPFDPPFLPE